LVKVGHSSSAKAIRIISRKEKKFIFILKKMSSSKRRKVSSESVLTTPGSDPKTPDVIGYCSPGSRENVITGELLDYDNEDVVLIFSSPDYSNAECILREHLRKMYKDTEVTTWDRKRLPLVKLPHSSVWVKDVDRILSSSRSTFVLDSGQEMNIGSQGGASRIHGEPHKVYSVSEAPLDPIIREIEEAPHKPRQILDSEEKESKHDYEREYKEFEDTFFSPSPEDTFLLQRSGKVVDLSNINSQVIVPVRKLVLENNSALETLIVPPTVEVLELRKCDLPTLPHLPETLKRLRCVSCPFLTTLPPLPNLERLNLTDCVNLRSLPPLPQTLHRLYTSNCQALLSLPHLPASLRYLYCDNCPSLSKIPRLPDFLKSFWCSECAFSSLPRLPNLKELNCSGCPIQRFPDLPVSLRSFWCSNCPMTRLPSLPPNLELLWCSDCVWLVSLPPLPDSLKGLVCSNCPLLSSLTSAPDVPLPPNLEELYCNGCVSLKFLPEFPDSIRKVECNNCTGLQVLPELQENVIFSCKNCPQ